MGDWMPGGGLIDDDTPVRLGWKTTDTGLEAAWTTSVEKMKIWESLSIEEKDEYINNIYNENKDNPGMSNEDLENLFKK